MSNKYQDYVERMRKIADLRYAAAVLQWDQETYLPEKGAESRGRQLATLTTLSHELFTDERLGHLLEDLMMDSSLDAKQEGNVRRTLEDYTKSKKYTSAFVHQLAMVTSECYHAWLQARKEDAFATYVPALQKMVDLKQQEAELLGYDAHPYNALLDDYEKGATVRMLDRIFEQVNNQLKPLVGQLLSQPSVDNRFLHQHFNRDQQWQYGLSLLQAIGFDFKAGRQDLSEHPFTTSFHPDDVRITTRIDEEDFANMCWSCIHEGGHALYEQGLPKCQYGLPAGEAASLSIHESQSRLWENNVGRSLPFWKHFYPELQETFQKQFSDIGLNEFYRGINKIQATPIRTESDELTYHFHILIRYEIEKELIAGDLRVRELKEVWNARYKKYLDLAIKKDREGILQDIHWSHGSFGYFPTYSLGSFYAAQFYETAKNELPDLEAQIAKGKLTGLLQWLRQNIHVRGSLLRSDELCQKVTGNGLDFGYFMAYAKKKYGGIYSEN